MKNEFFNKESIIDIAIHLAGIISAIIVCILTIVIAGLVLTYWIPVRSENITTSGTIVAFKTRNVLGKTYHYTYVDFDEHKTADLTKMQNDKLFFTFHENDKALFEIEYKYNIYGTELSHMLRSVHKPEDA